MSNSAIKLNLIVEHQSMMNMCGPGIRQIIFGENIISVVSQFQHFLANELCVCVCVCACV